MKTIRIGEEDYAIEFTFEAAEQKNLVQSMFGVISGAYVVRNNKPGGNTLASMVDGVSEMVADIPRIARNAFYAGLLEHNAVSEEKAKELMKQYMKQNGLSFNGLFEEMKQCMEDDGFFDLSGISEMVQKMNEPTEEEKRLPKQPQDHKKKQTSTK